MKAVYGECSLCRVKVLWNGAKDSLKSASYWKTTWTGSSCHHTGNDCRRECFSLGNRRITMDEIHRLLGITAWEPLTL
ncbi:hypothetical protein TNCV_4871961 [Trichonephila clavipes]|nr:hypothetical protein TNCV_4871961 [Trichonephila clavipes]